MDKKRIRDQEWYPKAVAACVVLSIAICIGVLFCVLLVNLGSVKNAIGTFIGYFKTIIIGCILAYIFNPLAVWLSKKPFKSMKSDKKRWTISVISSIVIIALVFVVLILLVIPQLISSLSGFIGKFDEYAASLMGFLGTLGVSTASLGSLESMTANALSAIQDFITKNAGSILGVAAGAGKGILTIGIALILSVYLMLSKKSVLGGVARLLRGLLKQKRYDGMVVFLKRCDDIFIHFVIYSLLESVIVGGVNFLFMLVMRMQYAGLISVVVGVCNLIPTFGPVIGGAIGAFILLLVDPIHALIFIVFTVGLQFVDGYILKPKIFGGSLGISGLLILVAVIVGGNMFGVLGMLLAIPAAAILDIVYKDYLLPFIEKDRG